MALKVLHTRGVGAATALRDFSIEGAAELGACTGAQSFRATRQSDGLPVLLHKFRPAAALLDLEPLIVDPAAPDFDKPFATQFTNLFVAAGSAYLVEPLPPGVALSDLWRFVLQKRPDQALIIITVVVRHLASILQRLTSRNRYHGALRVENIVLASTASFGVLTAHLPCREGRLWLRKDPESPLKPDCRVFADVLSQLLEIETRTAALQNVSTLLPATVRHRIRNLVQAVEHAMVPTG
jgi:hypothetical protein